MRPAAFMAVLAAALLATGSAAAGPRLRVAGLNVVCNAAYQRVCDAAGCVALDGNEIAVPVAFSFDGRAGELCMATGCHAVTLAALPGASAAAEDDILAAVLAEGALEGVVALKRDGAAFQFIQGGTSVWGGACAPASAP